MCIRNFQKNYFQLLNFKHDITEYLNIYYIYMSLNISLVLSPNNSVLGYKLLQNKSAHKGLILLIDSFIDWLNSEQETVWYRNDSRFLYVHVTYMIITLNARIYLWHFHSISFRKFRVLICFYVNATWNILLMMIFFFRHKNISLDY